MRAATRFRAIEIACFLAGMAIVVTAMILIDIDAARLAAEPGFGSLEVEEAREACNRADHNEAFLDGFRDGLQCASKESAAANEAYSEAMAAHQWRFWGLLLGACALYWLGYMAGKRADALSRIDGR